MAVTGTGKTPRNSSVSIADGTGSPITLALIRDVGDFQWVRNEIARLVLKTRGQRRGVVAGEDPDDTAGDATSVGLCLPKTRCPRREKNRRGVWAIVLGTSADAAL